MFRLIIPTIVLHFFMTTSITVMAQVKNRSISPTVLTDSMNIQPKPILMLISTDWCNYCRMQQAQLQKNQDFIAAKDQFYYVELNAETKDSIKFNGTVYRYQNTGPSTGIHGLAVELANQKGGIAYPTWILLDQKYKILFKHPGLLPPQELKQLLNAIDSIIL